MIAPRSQIGVLGGGQLGAFFTVAAKRLGYQVAVLDPDPQAPARRWADHFVCAAFEDPSGRESFLNGTQAVTYEWENIPADVVEAIEKQIPVRPGSRVLGLLQNRIHQKRFLSEHGFPVAPFRILKNPQELPGMVEDLGRPCICKAATAGYDGQGQWRLDHPEQVNALSELLPSLISKTPGAAGWVVEKRVPFVKELSVIVVRDEKAACHTYPVAENVHEDGVLRVSRVPALLDPAAAQKARLMAADTVAALEGVGVFCVEMFLLEDGGLLINEIAPRPHNSGHYTMDVCTVSQFEQQVRVLCGLPVLEARLLCPAVMINILGPEIRAVESFLGLSDLLSIPGIRLYHYQKEVMRNRRKMGHILLMETDTASIADHVQQVRGLLSAWKQDGP